MKHDSGHCMCLRKVSFLVQGSNTPGVIEGVPLPRCRVATVGCVVTPHCGAWVVGHCIQVVHRIYCKTTENISKRASCVNIQNQQYRPWSTASEDLYVLIWCEWCFLRKLTAVFGGKLSQVKILHGEVDKGWQFAGSSRFREALEVCTPRSQGACFQGAGLLYYKYMDPNVLSNYKMLASATTGASQ